MNNSFYRVSDIETIAQHMTTITRQALYQLRQYYKDDPHMLTKLSVADRLAKKIKLIRKAEAL